MIEQAHSAGVAIIGIACRFPGAADHRTFWRNLCDGRESITFLSDDELTAEGVAAELLRNPAYVKAAPVLPDFDGFDAAFFEYSSREARIMDPQQRLLLEVAWEAFEDAGYRPGKAAGTVGVFAGSGGVVTSYLVDRLPFSAELPGDTGGLAHLGNDKDFPSTRVSYKLDLTGPSINVQTACSTSLVAVHLACQSILAGECDMALAGAATVRIPQRTGYLSVKGGILSPDGHCRAFDTQAQGTIFGSGVGAVLLKDLAAAIADGDSIYAVIRGSAVNNDGADKVSYTASSVAGQARAMVEAMAAAEVSPDDIGYVECHGTGTIVGDPLEIDALSRAFRTGTDRRGFCAVGSVKTNIGHLEQTAGLAALIKAALALKNTKIPPSLNFRRPNPKIDFAATPFFVNTECREWPADHRPLLAAVNALGLGGTNAFAVLEAPPERAAADAANEPQLHLFTLSARTHAALRASIERHRAWLDATRDARLADVCFTLTQGRTHFAERFHAVVGSPAQLRDALAAGTVPGPQPRGTRRLAFLFSGQGSQYAGMAAELYRHQPVFRAVVDRGAQAVDRHLGRPLLEILFGTENDAALIDETAYTQPALFVVQAALVELWRSWGVHPDVVLGHSVGEFAAAHGAGVYALEEALELIAARARIMHALPRRGAMASVFANEEAVAAVIERLGAKDLAIAAVNGLQNVVVSGERAAVDAVLGAFESEGVGCRRLTVSHAFHSPLMAPAMDELGRVAGSIAGRAPQVPWISTVSGTAVTTPPGPRYWRDHARQAVRFADGIQQAAEMGATDFLEIGPGNTLLAFARQVLGDQQQSFLASLGQRRGDWSELLSSLGELYRRGYSIDWDGFNRPCRARRISLPTYPFEHRRFWMDGDRPRGETASPAASLTGVRLRSALRDAQFEAVYSLERFSYLDDHRIHAMPVLPMAAGLTALRDAAREYFGSDAVAVVNLQYREAMVLPEAGDCIVQSILTPLDDEAAELRMASLRTDPAGTWRTHMVGLVRRDASAQAPLELDRARLRCANPIPIDRYYATLRALGLEYGPSFRCLETLSRGNGEVLARARLPTHLPDESASWLHPALLDACLHTYPALVGAYGDFETPPQELRRTYLPVAIERFRGTGPGTREAWVHATRRDGRDLETLTIDLAIYRDDGSWIAAMEGLSLKPLPPEALSPRPAAPEAGWLYRMRWDERPALPASRGGEKGQAAGWVILADRGGVGQALADLLRERGATCRLVHLDDAIDLAGARSWRSSGDLTKPFAALLAELAEPSEPRVRGIIDLWALDAATERATLDEIEAAQKIVTRSALSLFRAVVEVRGEIDFAPRIWLVTRNAISARPDDPVTEFAAATLWGLGRSAALEHPQIWGGLLDLDARSGATASSDAARLLAEVLHGDGEDQVAMRSERRFAPRLARTPLPGAASAKFDVEGSYLITGGLGALGMTVAKWLATRHGVKHLILAGRNGPGDKRAQPARQALAALGANVRVLKADVTNKGDVRRLLSRSAKPRRPLKGVFHCAGLLDDGILVRMSWPKFRRVMAPKVAGAWLLHELTRNIQLDHFVLFSSILSLTGSAGQANYAAANAFLDALAAHRRSQGRPALALNWGPWAESGLATASGDKGRAIWRARGTEYISAETGRQALDALVGSDLSQAVVTITQWPVFLQQFETVPLLYGELQSEAVPPRRDAGSGPDAANIRSRLGEARQAERRGLLAGFVRAQAMKTLGVTDPIDGSRPLREFGLDSLMAVTLVNRLEAPLGIRISTVKLVQGPSIDALVDDILPEFAAGAEGGVEAEPTALPRGSAGSWLVAFGTKPAARFRLFCFPFAGGGSAVYRSWAQALDPQVEVVAIEPPGRLGRITEKPVSDIGEFVDRLVEELHDLSDRPFAFFGHCLGGLTMYETARRLVHSTRLRPRHLFASGARPPDRIGDQGAFEERLLRDLMRLADFRISRPAYAQPDDVFAELIRHFNIQATEQMLDDPKLRQLMLPAIRAEFRMASQYQFAAEPPWEIPITCFASRGDPYVSRRHALGWGRFTNSRLQVHIRPGTHFAVVDDAAFIQNVINRELQAELRAGTPGIDMAVV